MPSWSSSQPFGSHNFFPFLKILKDPKELLICWLYLLMSLILEIKIEKLLKGLFVCSLKTKWQTYVNIDNILKIKSNNIFQDRKKYFCKPVEEFCIFANSCNVWLPRRQLLLHSVCCNMCCVASRKFHCVLMRGQYFKKQIIPCCCLVVLVVKNLLASAGDTRCGFVPWVGKIPCRRKRQPSPISCLENPMDRKAWWVTVHRVAKSQTQTEQLRMHTCHCCSVPQSCLNLCDPMDCSMPAFPVLYYLLEFAQIHVHWGSDAI